MIYINKLSSLLLLIIFFGCNQINSNRSIKKLDSLIHSYQDHNGYDREKYPLGLFTREYYKSEADFAQEKLDELSEINLDVLPETDKISAELLKFVLEDKIAYYEFERFLNPLLSDSGFHINLGFMVRSLQNYNSVKDYLKKLNAIPDYVDQYFVNLREGLDKGVSQPKIIFKGYESTYETHIVDDFQESYFYSPLKKLPESLTSSQKDSILIEGKIAIENIVIPQFKRIKNFFETEYLPKTRTTIGVSDTPNGKAFYQNRINFYTTNNEFSPEDIHQIGLNEVKRIKAEMENIIDELEFKGSFSDFLKFLRTDKQFYAKTPDELLMIARDIAKRADEQLPKFFKTLPRKPYGVAPVPDAIAPKYTGGRYVGSSKNSSEPGYYWVNTYKLDVRPLYNLEALTLHEGVPGHHLQNSIASELTDLPDFRKDLYLSAFGEGWGLYSEYLGVEAGFYTDPYSNFGRLTYEMWRACRLVVDTGIHAMGWSRQKVIDYLSDNTALPIHECTTETDRYIAWPGQALSYKIGELKIKELRKYSEQELGRKFDVRNFHDTVLGSGSVPLDILEDQIKDWVASQKN